MKIKLGDLRKLIRENYAREIPSYAISEICLVANKMDPKAASRHCKEQLEHYFKMHINSTSASSADMRYKIAKMHSVLAHMEEEIRELKNLKEELQEIVDQHVRRFLFV